MGVVQNSVNQLFTLAAVGAGISPQLKEMAEIRGLNAQRKALSTAQEKTNKQVGPLSDPQLEESARLAGMTKEVDQKLFEKTASAKSLENFNKSSILESNLKSSIEDRKAQREAAYKQFEEESKGVGTPGFDSGKAEQAMKALEQQAIAKLEQSERFKNHLEDVKNLKEGIGDISGFSESAQKSIHRQFLQDPKVQAIVAEDIALEKEGVKR